MDEFPAALSSDATQTVSGSLEERLKERAKQGPPIDVPDGTPKRGRGRPAGSRNKPKGITPDMVIPAGQRGSNQDRDKTPEQIEAEQKRKADAKKKRASELERQIITEFNEQLMGVFMMMGIPAQVLYKPGQAPKEAPINTPYSDIGNMVAIGPMQAKTWARFFAELEATDTGGKARAAIVGDSKIPLVVSGVLAAGTAFQYLTQVKKTFDTLAPMIEQYKAYQKQQANQPKENSEGTV